MIIKREGQIQFIYPSVYLLRTPTLSSWCGVEVTKPITPPVRYLQSIGSFHRVSSDGAQDLNDLPESVTAHGESVDILESCALKYKVLVVTDIELVITFILSQSHCASLSMAPCLSMRR